MKLNRYHMHCILDSAVGGYQVTAGLRNGLSKNASGNLEEVFIDRRRHGVCYQLG